MEFFIRRAQLIFYILLTHVNLSLGALKDDIFELILERAIGTTIPTPLQLAFMIAR